MRVLFSPIGSADPLTDLGDGPMLHIVRNYQPQKIVLFLSPAMAKREDQDSRNKKAIELLAKELGIETPEVQYENSEQEDAHRYDFYIDDFSEILTRLDDENPDAEILINVSSGTPAMDQALVAFDAFDQLGLRALQVETPAKDKNQSDGSEDSSAFDLEKLWEHNPDKGSKRKNRCVEVESVHFNDLLLRDNIRALVDDFDYTAASYLASQSRSFPSGAKTYIDGCVARMNLDNLKAAKLFGGTEFAYDPAERLQDYLWVLEVYVLREQWADYLRAITPALYETLHTYIRNDLKLSDDAWLKSVENKSTGLVEYKLDSQKILDNDRLKNVFDRGHIQNEPYASNGDFARVIDKLGPENDERVQLMQKLRKLESGARHPLAHTTCRAEKESLEKAGGMKLEDSLDALFKLNKVEPGLYKRINEAIINLM